MPRLERDVDTSEVQDPTAPRREVLGPLARHSLAAHDEEAMAIGHDENRHVVRFARLAPEGCESDLSLIFRGLDHVLVEAAHIYGNRSPAARNSTSLLPRNPAQSDWAAYYAPAYPDRRGLKNQPPA